MSLDIWLTFEADTGGSGLETLTLFDANFTHNVTNMWSEAGIYDALYNSAGKTAGEVLSVLIDGQADMLAFADKYRAMDALNGWGTYEQALPWLNELIEAFRKHPRAVIGLSK